MSSPTITCSVDGPTSPAFRPYLIPQYPSVAGLRIFVGPGSVYINGVTVKVAQADLSRSVRALRSITSF